MRPAGRSRRQAGAVHGVGFASAVLGLPDPDVHALEPVDRHGPPRRILLARTRGALAVGGAPRAGESAGYRLRTDDDAPEHRAHGLQRPGRTAQRSRPRRARQPTRLPADAVDVRPAEPVRAAVRVRAAAARDRAGGSPPRGVAVDAGGARAGGGSATGLKSSPWLLRPRRRRIRMVPGGSRLRSVWKRPPVPCASVPCKEKCSAPAPPAGGFPIRDLAPLTRSWTETAHLGSASPVPGRKSAAPASRREAETAPWASGHPPRKDWPAGTRDDSVSGVAIRVRVA